MKRVYLSYHLSPTTPSYGGGDRPSVIHESSERADHTISMTKINTSLHTGTHIDFPKHFFLQGKTADEYSPEFWFFENPLLIEISPESLLIKDELIEKILKEANSRTDLILIKTGACTQRDKSSYYEENYGIESSAADIIRENMPNVRAIGIDSISVSSYKNREEGRKAHLAFLKPESPILIIEDMDLNNISCTDEIKRVILMPVLTAGADAAQCTIIGEIL